MNPRIDRRRMLAAGLSFAGLSAVSSPFARAATSAFARAARRSDGARAQRKLVLIQLTGGNDGLSTLVPFADDAYYRARPSTAIPKKEVLRLDGYVGLHPSLRRVRARFDEGELAIVQGTGYPNPVLSHFKALEVWHTASERGRNEGAGWVARLAEDAWRESLVSETLIHIGNHAPYSIFSRERLPVSLGSPEAYRWYGTPNDQGSLEGFGRENEPEGGVHAALDRIRGTLDDARDTSARIRSAGSAYRPHVEYVDTPFSQSLRHVAALIDAKLETRVYSVELTGFDTHASQRGTHDGLMKVLDRGLDSFLADLAAAGHAEDILVVAFSEFGRRVTENNSAGHDHGTAGPILLAGPVVKGGLHGRHPSLDELDENNLLHTTDFRSVYAAIIDDWFGADSEAVLGKRYPKLALI